MLDVARPGPDYTLRWPRELFAQEARAILAAQPVLIKGAWTDQVEWLLIEAFPSSTPVTDFRGSTTKSTWTDQNAGRAAKVLPYLHQPGPFMQALIDATPRLPEQATPRPYYAARHGQQPVEPAIASHPDTTAARRDWLIAISSLRRNGYLAHIAPEICASRKSDDQRQPDDVLDDLIADRLGIRGLWMDRLSLEWDETTFYSLIEVLHDLVERPRSRDYDSWDDCGWHYSDFAFYPAQVLYRWTVNRILARHGIALVLAKNGEDVGRLVHQPHDGRAVLVESAVGTQGPATRSTVEHAISLFRGRGATRETKRSACIALAGLLEERRNLLEDHLLSKDEGALFQIANQFAVRHRRADQRSDYDEAYLDWLFWWYLATFELTDKLLGRPGSAAP